MWVAYTYVGICGGEVCGGVWIWKLGANQGLYWQQVRSGHVGSWCSLKLRHGSATKKSTLEATAVADIHSAKDRDLALALDRVAFGHKAAPTDTIATSSSRQESTNGKRVSLPVVVGKLRFFYI